jgi:Protein of unknown function (DUF1569)
MNAGRRSLRFDNYDEVMADVERLLEGHTTVGTWSLGQICRHLATVARRVVDLPASTPSDPSQWVGEERKRQVFETRLLPEGLPGPPEIMPPLGLDDREEAEGLRRAIAHFLASPGPVIPHRLFGPMTRAEWHQLQLIHLAHHLSFAVPKAG